MQMSSANPIARGLEPVLRRAAKEFPAVILTGPRQSGKTTLLNMVFGHSHRYLSLETPDVRLAALADPRGFLDRHPPPVIFDEVQYAAELLPYIKERIDLDRTGKGLYLLTGSQNLLLLQHVTESLAGRAAVLKLLPLSRREIEKRDSAAFAWEVPVATQPETPVETPDPWPALLRGAFPELVANPERDSWLWHASYIQTYLERDVRSLRQVGDLLQFQSFLRALAARNAQLLQLTEIARDIGIAVNTAKAWLSVLETSYQIILLRPYFANLGKRLVKTPKVYFTDLGTLAYLTGIRTPEHASAGPMGGSMMETAVILEIYKTLLHRGEEPRLHFWRTGKGSEVDLLVEREHRLIPVEVKLSSTPKPEMGDSIRAFRRDLKKKAAPGYVVHPGTSRLPLGPNVSALPFSSL